jgi:MraZ protein
MFRGIFHNSVDEKGRMSIPVRLRDQIRDNHTTPLILTLGFDQCLNLYPSDTWQKIEENLSSTMNSLSSEDRQFVRTVMKAVDEVEMDQQGRVVISPVLRKEAGLGKNVVIAGLLNHIEIWDKQKYESYHAQQPQSLELLGQKLSDKGLKLLF